MTHSWEHKSLAEHQIVADLIQKEIDKKLAASGKPNEKGEIQIQVETNKVDFFRQVYRPMDLVFTPEIAISALVKHLSDFDMLSGTTAYKVIQDWSYDNK